MLLKRLQRQEVKSLARKVYEEQLRLGWQGLAKEVKEISSEVGLPDINQIEVKNEKVKGEILVGMVIPVTPGPRKFRIAMCTVSGIFKQKYCEYMSRLRDKTVSQLKS